MSKRASPEKEAYWRKMVLRQQEGGLSVRQFCREQSLSEPSFYSWKREIARRDRQGVSKSGARRGRSKKKGDVRTGAPFFIPLQLTGEIAHAVELVHPRGHVLRIPAGFDEDSLQKLLTLLDRKQEA